MKPRRDDRGAGLFGTIGGVTVVLCFLLFAVQLLVGLYVSTTVTAIAHDTAQRAAAVNANRDPEGLEAYERDAERSLGGVRGQVDFDGSEDVDGDLDLDVIVVHVVATPPRFIPPLFDGDLGLGTVERTVRVRVETFQDDVP